MNKEKVEIIRLALLASYNTDRPLGGRIANEDALEIWRARAENTLRGLDSVPDDALAARIADEGER